MTILNEKDKLQDMLSIEKEMVKAYGTYLTEGSTQEYRNLIQKNMTECSEDQFCVFEKMTARNYYAPKQAQPTDIMQEKTKFENMKNQLTDIESK